MLRRSLLILCLLLSLQGYAYHIIGGEMIYDRLAGNTFRVTLKIYRDCANPDAAEFDDPLQIYVYREGGVLYDSLVLYFPGSDLIDPSIINPCIEISPDLCVQEAIYEGTIDLPPSVGGYDLVYQRCCRNTTILNIYDPLYTGATYAAHIPDPGSIINSSPRFNSLPPVAICAGYPFAFDHAATDPDGDALLYRFFTPYTGASFDAPDPSPASPPPFTEISFLPPFSETYPVASSPAFAIDPASGWLAGTPTDLGQYVVGVAVEERRAGVLIAVHYRDFQFNVTDCVPSIVAAAPAEVNECSDMTVSFENWSVGTDEFIWDFGVPDITTDVSSEENPTYTYPDTGTYIVTLIAYPGYDCSDTTYITVDVYPQLIADIDFDNTCAGAPVSFQDMSTTDYGTLTTWEWNYGDGWGSVEQSPVYTYDEPGSYMLIFTVTNSVGCTAQLYDTITIYPPAYAMIETDTACIGGIDTVEDGSFVLLPNIIESWEWVIGTDTFDTEDFPYHFDTAGVYPVSVLVTTDMGCVDSASATIYVAPPVVAPALADALICEGDTVHLVSGGGTDYAWTPAEYASSPDAQSTWFTPEESTMVQVVVTDGCTTDSASAFIEVMPAPDIVAGPDTTVVHFQEVNLYAYGAETYSWSPAAGLSDSLIANPVATPDQSTAYVVTGTGANGCTATDTAFITILPLCVPYSTVNAFSPNGDGINDRFRLITPGDDSLLSMEIYNRWGQRIFFTNSLADGWDGTDGNGVAQEVGMYVFVMYTDCDGVTQQVTGSVTLLR